MRSLFKKKAEDAQRFFGTYDLVKVQSMQQEAEYKRIHAEMAAKYPDNIALLGYKVYSQTDEDGIIEAIFKRIPNDKRFVEIGIQTGIECNTINLLLNGWKGTWIEGSSKYCRKIAADLKGISFPNKLNVVNAFVDKENIIGLFKTANDFFNSTEIDFFSLDIDGNDYHIMEVLLVNAFLPKVICVEYNAKFRPPLKFEVKYDPKIVWDGTDYQGCSLQSYVDLLAGFNYTLICCNLPGTNAFFVRNEFVPAFTRYSTEELYQPNRYYLSPIRLAHKPSLFYLRDMLAGNNNG